MKLSIQQFSHWLSTRNDRERILIACIAIVITWFLWNSLIESSISKKLQTKKDKIVQLSQEVLALQKQANDIMQRTKDPLWLNKKSQEKNLAAITQALIKQLQIQKNNAISLEKLPMLITDVLARQQTEITPVELKDLPATPWLSPDFKDIQLPNGAEHIKKYSFSMIFRGDYPATVRYLERLSASPWHLYLTQLDYRVTIWPQAEVTLIFYVLVNDYQKGAA